MNAKEMALAKLDAFDWSDDRKKFYNTVHNMRWSFSRVNGFDCPYCWMQSYYFGRRDEGLPNAFSDVGTLVHELQEMYLKNELQVWEILPLFNERFVSEVGEFPPNKYVNLREKYYSECTNYLENYSMNENWEVVAVEQEANLIIEGYPFIGYIDLLLKDKKDGKYIILDYKSKAEFKNKDEQKKYARQLYLYAEFVKQYYGEYPKMLIFDMFRMGKKVPIFFKQSGVEEAMSWVVDTIMEISMTDTFSVTEDSFFGNYLCNFREDEKHILGEKYTLEELMG